MNNNVRLGLDSVTYAIQARDILQNHGMRANVVRLHSGESSMGCAFGVELSRRDIMAAASLLINAGIAYRQLN